MFALSKTFEPNSLFESIIKQIVPASEGDFIFHSDSGRIG